MHPLLPASALALLALLPQSDGDEDAPDRVHLAGREQPIECRVLRRWAEDGRAVDVRLPGGKEQELARADVVRIDARRDRLAEFMTLRRPDDDVARSFELVGEAARLRLPRMARVQAYYVLTLDPGHVGAHEWLGHERHREAWLWRHTDGLLREPQFRERIAEWKGRFVLQSEHFVLESDAGLARTVRTAFDLEFLYLDWMERFAQEIRAAEDVDRFENRMAVHLFRSKDDDGFRDHRTGEREPYYDPSTVTTTVEGDQNLAFLWYDGEDSPRPYRLFDVATHQVLYSTMVFGRHKGGVPPDSLSHYAHWVELGLGHWMAGQIGGPPGFPERKAFRLSREVAELALHRPRSGPLSSAHEELTNLVGMDTSQFYRTGDEDDLLRAKAQAFTAYLLEEDPETYKRGRSEVVGSGRAGLVCYLRDAYGTATAHSSSALDDCLGESTRVEMLGDRWREWLRSLTAR